MKRTNLKVRVKDGTKWVIRTVFENNGTHYIKSDGRYFKIYKTDRGIYKAALYVRVEYIA